MRVRHWIIFCLIGLLIFSPVAEAQKCPVRFKRLFHKVPGDIYLSKANQLALETPSGKALLAELGFKDVDDLQRFLNGNTDPTAMEFRRQLQERLREIDSVVAYFRGMQVKANASLAGRTPDSALIPEESILVNFMAERQLTLNPGAKQLLVTKGSDKKTAFFRDLPDGDAKAIEAARQKLSQVGQNQFRAMRECLKNQPPSESFLSKRAVAAAISQLKVSLSITTASAIAVPAVDKMTAADFSVMQFLDDFRYTDLSLMLLLTALNSGLGTVFLNNNGSATMRVIKAIALFQGINVVNVGLYAAAPAEEKASPLAYGAYYAAFGVAVPAASLPLNEFLAGYHCLYPDSKWFGAVDMGSRTLFSAAVNVLFFLGEEVFLYPDKKENK